jgi:aryl-alcohol dehydrogenase-like predicted oxidoreductase
VSAPDLPSIVLGTASLGSVLPDALVSATSRERAFRMLDAMVDLGCTALDIAASYMIGGTERLLGAWMASRRNRDRLLLVTKGGHPIPVLQPHRLTPAAITADLHASLRRLRTERVELYLLHRDDEGARLERLVESLAAHQRVGKIAAWGVSNWRHERIQIIDDLARAAGVPGVAASSPHLSLAEWTGVPWRGCVSLAGEANREARAFYERTKVPVLAWSPLGRGFFSSRAASTDRVYGSAANLARKKRAEELGRERGGVSAAQIALAYVLSQPFPVHAVVSASVDNMRSNLEARALRLSPKELRWLESGARGPR